MRTLSLVLLLAGCSKPELIRYTIDVQIDAPDDLNPSNTVYRELLGCDTAEVLDETLVVYDGMVADPVAAIRLVYTGFDLSEGGENTETLLLAEGQTATIFGTLSESVALYEIDAKGRMIELDKDVARVRKKSEAEAQYAFGAQDALVVDETHVLRKEVDEVLFIEQGVYSCEHTTLQ